MHQWSRFLVLAGVLSLFGAATPESVTAHREARVQVTRWAWVSVRGFAAGVSYPSHQGSSANQTNSVHRHSVGAYTVTFPSVGSGGGVVHVTSADTGRCYAAGWGPSGQAGLDLAVDVRCFWGIAQEPDDVAFNASYLDTNASAGRLGYLRADRPTATSLYQADPTHSFNSTGGTNTIKRTSVGNYVVRLPGLGAASNGSVQVSTYIDLKRTCRVADWRGTAGVQVVKVACRNLSGALVDTRFVLTFTHAVGLLGSNGKKAAYLWAQRPAASSYQPDANHRWTSAATVPTVTRDSTGHYIVVLQGFGRLGGAAFVTSTGAGSVSCAIRGRGDYGPTNVIDVDCSDTQHGPANGTFTLSFVGWAATQ